MFNFFKNVRQLLTGRVVVVNYELPIEKTWASEHLPGMFSKEEHEYGVAIVLVQSFTTSKAMEVGALVTQMTSAGFQPITLRELQSCAKKKPWRDLTLLSFGSTFRLGDMSIPNYLVKQKGGEIEFGKGGTVNYVYPGDICLGVRVLKK